MLEIRAATVTRLLDAGPEGRIGCARTVGPTVVATTAGETAWALVERGTATFVTPAGTTRFGERGDVFSAAGASAFLGPSSRVEIAGEVALTIVWRAARAADRPGVEIVDPAAVPDEHRGTGTTARDVRTYRAAGSMIVGETRNPPGGWSSWPPHSHAHEEIYLYRFDPPHGFGVHVDLAAGGGRGPRVVRDGDIVRIVDGEHPVVAAPGCAMYYLWALVGDADAVDTRVDPRFAP